MRSIRPAPGLLLAVLSCAAATGALPSGAGIAPAEAAEFYTRKRVNGKWITGRFPKQGGAAKRQAKAGSVPAAVAAAPAAAAAAPTALASTVRAEEAALRAPPAPAVPLAGDERLLALQQALEARAGSLVGPASQPQPAPESATGSLAPALASPPVEPRSVAFDFQSGMKTTLFTNGASITEPFDAGAIRPFASRPPVSVGAAQ